MLNVDDLKVWFPVRRSFLSSLIHKELEYVHAVDGVSLKIDKGEIFCLAGESGCGKTTIGRAILGFTPITEGKVCFEGQDLSSLGKEKYHTIRREIQMVYQDPYESLNPKLKVYDTVVEPIEVHKLAYNDYEKKEMVKLTLEAAGLTPVEEFMDRYPHELSGGQRQRVAIATVLALKPKFIIADEPASMLDASVRADILNLILNLKKSQDITFLFITHDIAMARYVGDRIAIMYLGKLFEIGSMDDIISKQLHPYTEALISVVPVPNPKIKSKKIILQDEIPSPVNIPPGCRFHPRCRQATDICRIKEPQIEEVEKGHYVACHLV